MILDHRAEPRPVRHDLSDLAPPALLARAVGQTSCTAYSTPKSRHTDEQWGHKRQGENRFAPDEGHVISAAFSAAFSNNFWAASKAAFNHAANMILR